MIFIKLLDARRVKLQLNIKTKDYMQFNNGKRWHLTFNTCSKRLSLYIQTAHNCVYHMNLQLRRFIYFLSLSDRVQTLWLAVNVFYSLCVKQLLPDSDISLKQISFLVCFTLKSVAGKNSDLKLHDVWCRVIHDHTCCRVEWRMSPSTRFIRHTRIW